MREGDAAFEALRAAIDELAALDARGLLDEARAEARTKVRSILAEAIAQALLDHSSEALAEERGRASDGGADAGRGASAGRAGRSAGAEATPGADATPGAEPRGSRAEGAFAAESGIARAPSAPTPRRERAETDSPPTAPPAAPEAAPAPAPESPASSASQPEASAEPETGVGWYVYCVLDPRSLEPPPDIEGVDGGRAVSVIGEGDIAALASEVPLAEFGEDRLRENLNDVAWLEATALAHERVLESALARTTVIPMRLCTIYASEESVREMLARERPVFGDALSRLEGRTEWGVKMFVDRRALEEMVAERSPEVAALREEVEALPEGEAYMQRKRLDTVAGEEADALVDECVDDVHGRLAGRAAEALLNPLQRPEVSGRAGEMLLNGVYLVEDTATDAFHTAVDELKAHYDELGFEIELTGPWPPYNFVKSSIEAAR